MKNYTHIFFDLDRTLWDFQQNSSDALRDALDEFGLHEHVRDADLFIRYYNEINDNLWDHLREGKIRKYDLRRERFRRLMARYKISDKQLIDDISAFYLNMAPSKPALMPNAKEILNYLSGKYRICVISNGFYDVQLTKLINSGISKYFLKLFTSDIIGIAKPKKGIFAQAISSVNARKDESIMVGDDPLNDIRGAQIFGIDQVYYNPGNDSHDLEPTHEIRDLIELREIL